jgi:hypothetical protein
MSCASVCMMLTPQTPGLDFDSRVLVGYLALWLSSVVFILIPLILEDLRLQIRRYSIS